MTLPAKILHVPSVHDSLVLLYSTAGLESDQDLKFRLSIQSIILKTNINSFFCISLSRIIYRLIIGYIFRNQSIVKIKLSILLVICNNNILLRNLIPEEMIRIQQSLVDLMIFLVGDLNRNNLDAQAEIQNFN
jgi:hypothetical protein